MSSVSPLPFRLLASSPIFSDDEEDLRPRSQTSLTYQELPLEDSLLANLPHILFSFEMIDCFIPEGSPIRSKNWYNPELEEWPHDELSWIKQLVVEVLKTEFRGWTSHPDESFPDYAEMSCEQLSRLLVQATSYGAYQLSLKVLDSLLFSHYMDSAASSLGIDALVQSLNTLSSRNDLPPEASSLTAAIMGKFLIYQVKEETLEIVYGTIHQSNYFDLISPQDLNRALFLALQKEHEALILMLLESNRLEDFDHQLVVDTLQMAIRRNYDRIILTLMYSGRAQELIARPMHGSGSSSSTSFLWTGR